MKTEEDKEVDEFLKKRPIIPCFLISKDEGRIELNVDGFEKKKIPIEKIKENYFKMTYEEVSEDFNLIIDKKISSDISMHGNNLNFDAQVNRNKENGEEHKVFIGEYKLYSFNIREEDLSFSEYYMEKFKKISNSFAKNPEKAKDLEEIFKSVGFYIPKKIYIGGMIIVRIDKERKAKDESTINSLDLSLNKNVKIDSNFSSSNKSKLNQLFKSEKTEIIGGDNTAKTFEDWIKSINLSNSNVIECSNIITAKNLIEYNLRKSLETPLRIIEEKYLRKKKYLEYINEMKNHILGTYEGDFAFSEGICKEMKKSVEPNVYYETFEINKKASIKTTKEQISKTYNDVIVGFHIFNDRFDNHNGKWTIKNNPLGKKTITISFESKWPRSMKYTVFVYLMKYPQ